MLSRFWLVLFFFTFLFEFEAFFDILFLNKQKTGAPELTQRQEELFKQEFEKLSRSVNAVFVQKNAEQEKEIQRLRAELEGERVARNKPPLPPSEEHFHVERSAKDINMLFSELQTGRTTIKNLKEKVDTLNTKVQELQSGHEHMDELRQKAAEVDEKIRLAEEKTKLAESTASKLRAKIREMKAQMDAESKDKLAVDTRLKEADARCEQFQKENTKLKKENEKIKQDDLNQTSKIDLLELEVKDKQRQHTKDQSTMKSLSAKIKSMSEERDEALSRLAKFEKAEVLFFLYVFLFFVKFFLLLCVYSHLIRPR